MTRAVQAAVAVVAAIALPAAPALAADAPAPVAAPPAPPAAEAAPPAAEPAPALVPYEPAPQYYVPPPAPYGALPPPAVYPPPLSPAQLTAYEAGSKSHAVAILLTFVFPGLGSVYADHPQGFFVTWLGLGSGVGLVIYGVVGSERGSITSSQASTMIAVGSLMFVGFSIYSFVDAWSSVTDYNEDLATRLGMQSMRITVAPISTGRDVAWGPALSLRF